MKDQASAQHLLDDIEAAQLCHPSPRQDSVFSSRTSTIVKRLLFRESPSSIAFGLLRQTHALFPDQLSANEAVTKVLGEELEIGLTLARRLERSSLEYHATCEAVRTAEHNIVSANELSNVYDSVLHHMLNGVEPSDGDGTPPDLSSELCLRETKHAAFLALLPSLLQQLDKSDEEARSIVPTTRASLLSLSDINVEPGFKDRLVAAIQRLDNVKADSDRTRQSMTERVNTLRHARKIWVSVGSILEDLGTIRGEMGDLMEQQKWRASTTSNLPPTPESSHASLPLSNKTLGNATEQVTLLQASIVRDVQTSISTLPGAVGPVLRMYLVKNHEGLLAILEHTQQMIRLADNVSKQALTMTAIRDETHDFQVRVEDTESRFGVLAEQILEGSLPDDILDNRRQDLAFDATSIQTACQTFMDSLPHRVIFVSPDTSGTVMPNTPSSSLRRRFSLSLDLTLEALQSLPPLELPIDLAHLDHVVRTDCNAFALHVATGISSLQQKMVNLDVVQDARAVDVKLASLRNTVILAEERLDALRDTISTVPDTFDTIDRLASVAGEAGPAFDAQRSEISRSLSPIRQLLHKMDIVCSRNPNSRPLTLSRGQAVDDMEAKFRVWSDGTKAFLSDIRQREERLRAAQREQNEREQVEAEAADRLRKEQAEAEAKLKAEEERSKMEREREEAEVAERLRRGQAEAEERMRVERERAEELAREQAQDESNLPPSIAFPCVVDGTSANEDDLGMSTLITSFLLQLNDVFGLPDLSSEGLAKVQSHVAELRLRLRSLGIKTAAKPSPSSVSPLLTIGQHTTMASQLTEVLNEAMQLPAHTSDVAVDAELKSLQDELDASHQLLPHALSLAQFGSLVQDCDNALSDLLEHIDSYPAPPSGLLAANYVSSNMLPPEEQLNGRLAFTKNLVDQLGNEFAPVVHEPKASSERQRIVQTWAELESMGVDRINGRRSRPGSTISSGRNSRASVAGHRPMPQKKSSQYSTLSAGGPARGRVDALAHPSTSSRKVSRDVPPMPNRSVVPPMPNRSLSRLSVVSSNRSVSGPNMAPSSRLFSSTFASRQRTISLSSTTSNSVPNDSGRRSVEPSRLHLSRAGNTRRAASPTFSDASGVSRPFSSAARPTYPTWGRPPRSSLSSNPHHKSPLRGKPPLPQRKPYVANPKSKLDVAVGDVVNKLPEDVDIKVEVAQDTWQDKSGKYWIGSEDPKLCFCRILRSHTVMVRVGGGWMELSK
jgi:Growth-Arrest-Specific Protein 2 Domain